MQCLRVSEGLLAENMLATSLWCLLIEETETWPDLYSSGGFHDVFQFVTFVLAIVLLVTLDIKLCGHLDTLEN